MNLDDPLFVSEGTIRSVLDAGFKDSFKGARQERLGHPPSERPYPDTAFDYVFHRGFGSSKAVSVMLKNKKPINE